MDDKAKKDFFERIYKEIFPIVIKVSYRITKSLDAAQDVCQEAFIKLYNRVETFPEVEDAKFWLIRVVKNLSFNYLEHEKVKNRAFDKIKHLPSFSDDTGEKQLLKKDAVEKVNKALDQLPENLKAPLILREFGGLNYKEIGAALGISESNVKIRIFRAREALGKLLPVGEVYVP
ncbi:MAG: RNA polymerase sigma factor [Spirochaetia bacterium]|nr:RNA polymerase sigma factor [Spirochaetia bacterium]